MHWIILAAVVAVVTVVSMSSTYWDVIKTGLRLGLNPGGSVGGVSDHA